MRQPEPPGAGHLTRAEYYELIVREWCAQTGSKLTVGEIRILITAPEGFRFVPRKQDEVEVKDGPVDVLRWTDGGVNRGDTWELVRLVVEQGYDLTEADRVEVPDEDILPDLPGTPQFEAIWLTRKTDGIPRLLGRFPLPLPLPDSEEERRLESGRQAANKRVKLQSDR